METRRLRRVFERRTRRWRRVSKAQPAPQGRSQCEIRRLASSTSRGGGRFDLVVEPIVQDVLFVAQRIVG
jgi:hypothetical protein